MDSASLPPVAIFFIVFLFLVTGLFSFTYILVGVVGFARLVSLLVLGAHIAMGEAELDSAEAPFFVNIWLLPVSPLVAVRHEAVVATGADAEVGTLSFLGAIDTLLKGILPVSVPSGSVIRHLFGPMKLIVPRLPLCVP